MAPWTARVTPRASRVLDDEDVPEAVRLRVIDERGYDEIAETLGTTPATARVRVHRGLAALRKERSR